MGIVSPHQQCLSAPVPRQPRMLDFLGGYLVDFGSGPHQALPAGSVFRTCVT